MWSDILIAAFEGYVYLSFFCRVFKRKSPFGYFVPAHAAFIAGMCLLDALGANSLVFMLFSVASAFGFSLFYSATNKRRFFYACLITIFNMGAELAVGYTMMRLYQQPIDNISEQSGLYIIGALISKLVFLLLVRIVCRIHQRHDITLPLMQCLTVMLIPVVSIAAMHGLAEAAADCIIETPIAAFFILGGMMLINMIVFILYDVLSGQSAKLLEHEKEKSRFDLEKQRYESLIHYGREMGAMVHDTYKHLRVLSSLVGSGDMEAVSAYVYKLDEGAHQAYGEQVLPGYPAIDAVLRRKISEAGLQGISVTHEINLFPGLAIEPVDICVVLGNALDNAIEACAHLESDRRIDIRMSFTQNKLAIVIANTSRPVEIIGDICVTTKEDKQAHGYGFTNMQRTVKKYRGNLISRYENGTFTLHILMLI